MKRRCRFNLTILLIITLLIATVVNPINGMMTSVSARSFTNIIEQNSHIIGDEVTYHWYDMIFNNKPEKVHYVEFDLNKNPNLELQVVKSYGHVYGFERLSNAAISRNYNGNRVIAGINGDFYHTVTGIPVGLFINQGELISSPPTDWYAFGIKSNNEVIAGKSPKMSSKLILEDSIVNITHINRLPLESHSLILFNNDFYTSTKTSGERDEYIFEIVEESLYEETLNSEDEIEATEEIEDELTSDELDEETNTKQILLQLVGKRENANNTPIKENQIVLSAIGQYKEQLATIEIDDYVMVYTELEEKWQDVTMAIGGQELIVSNGQVTSNSTTALHPRSAIGVTEEGKIIMLQVDGRSRGISEGVTLKELGTMMKDLGAVNAINLDGGGSATMVARLPGEKSPTVLNNPSDGSERRVANNILLVDKSLDGEASMFYIHQDRVNILVGNEYQYTYTPLDNSYYPVDYDGEVLWSVDNDLGKIDANGKFIASMDHAGEGQIWALSDEIYGSTPVEVVADLTHLRLNSDQELWLGSNGTRQFEATALRNGEKILASNDSFEWIVEGDIGTIDENGFFKGTQYANEKGTVIARYTNPINGNIIESTVKVTVGRDPIDLEDFETDILEKWKVSGINYKQVAISEETNAKYVKSGNQSLRLDYDFTETSGTSGVYVEPKDNQMITLEGYPTKIGMWVYGDGSGNWLRTQLRDGNNNIFNIDFVDSSTGIDFEGWKYLEAEIPQGKTLPLKMDTLIRYMGINDNGKNKGSLFIDDIRVLYGDEVESTLPEILNYYPFHNQLIESEVQEIYAYVENVESSTIKLYVNNNLVEHQYNPENGLVSYQLDRPLEDGTYNINLSITDDENNETKMEWTFTVKKSDQIHFTDVPKDFWAQQAILELANKGIVSGKGNNLFAPLDNITRAEVATLVVRLFELTGTENALEFNDLTGDEWYANYVDIATSNGIVSGYEDGTFRGDDLITRQELSVMVHNALKITNQELSNNPDKESLLDTDEISGFAVEAVEALYKADVINGYPDKTFKPVNNALRAETAVIIYNILNEM
ncbi:S-layer family protein [Natranaerovirga hydrolytica]|uniref:S-layer family protein n=1 Tax=Natranaerovirga hydrolytica TaxID=680378 RepID=A0A4R1MYP5_9FIRM|nr:phosphodiester glycosidase family protein [Natranaerovirga hydrolytica]TCK98427.1 S-layer family protein [Natranaerovirga hydrolytica]